VDWSAKSVFYQQGQPPAVIDMGVREEYGVDRPGIEVEITVLSLGLFSSALEHPAIDKELPASGREPVQRAGDFARRAFERQFHSRQGYPGDPPGRAEGLRGLVSHGINEVVCGDFDAERGKLLVILRNVGPFPGIAEIHVVADRDDEAPAIIIDAFPLRNEAV